MRKIRSAAVAMLFAAVISGLVSGCGEKGGTEPEPQSEVFAADGERPGEAKAAAQDGRVARAGDDVPVSRAIASKMMAFALSSKLDIEMAEREIEFTDVAEDAWYYKYVNFCFIENVMSGFGSEFRPNDPLTLEHAQVLLNKINPASGIKLEWSGANGGNAVSYALWTDLYYKALSTLAADGRVLEATGLEKADITVLATPANNDGLPPYNLIYDNGPLSYAGLDLDGFNDKRISVLRKDGEIVAFLGVVSETPTITSAYIVSKTTNALTVFVGGAERTYLCADTKEIVAGAVCDLRISGNRAESVVVYSEKISGVVKKAGAGGVELEGRGMMKTAEGFKVYQSTDGLARWRGVSALIAGSDIADYYMKDGEIAAAVIRRTVGAEKIRVIIGTTGFKSLLHEEVELTASAAFSVKSGGKTTKYKANEVLRVSRADKSIFGDEGRIYIYPDSEGEKIRLLSVKRSWEAGESPRYRGVIEISAEEGGFYVINELTMDQYLYAVVPSEMPSSFGEAAAKVQAVCARSYAYNQFYGNRFYRYGANVDDSVACQVYNNTPENALSIAAVDDTHGKYLTYNGSVISANYFSTSAGHTANAGEVWANSATRAFPDSTASYLRAAPQYTAGDYGDLSAEENAAAFFKATDIKSYDSAFAWFRWRVSMTAEELAGSINAALASRYAANPRLIKTLQPDGSYKSKEISSIGRLINMEVVRRGEGGNVMTLKIVGSDATILVQTEYNVRVLLAPTKRAGRDVEIVRKDGSIVKNQSLMPSAFFTMDAEYGGGALSKITFYGGGNGHGAGMSQNGVKGMIDAGFGFEEILQHYYKGAKISAM